MFIDDFPVFPDAKNKPIISLQEHKYPEYWYKQCLVVVLPCGTWEN